MIRMKQSVKTAIPNGKDVKHITLVGGKTYELGKVEASLVNGGYAEIVDELADGSDEDAATPGADSSQS
ncbi:MAG: hypothetical protein KDJ39_05935 [Gammaproteobacteria bacterium]|nr:hypothetical protein [Gammaproteobacteria bacterium]